MKRRIIGMLLSLGLCLTLLPGTASASSAGASAAAFIPIVENFDKADGRCLLYDVNEDGTEELILSYSTVDYDVDWEHFTGEYGYVFVEIYKAHGSTASLMENYELVDAVGVQESGSLGLFEGHCYFVKDSSEDGLGGRTVELQSFTSAPDHTANWMRSPAENPALTGGMFVDTYRTDGNECTEREYDAFLAKITTVYSFVSGRAGDQEESLSADEMLSLLSTSNAEIGVTVNGKAVEWTDAVPFIDSNSRTMVPLRAVAEALGLNVNWDADKREASFSKNGNTIWFPINSMTARTSDGKTISMDTAAIIRDGRTYAPIRYLAEYFGYSVGWDAATKTVTIE